MKTSSAIAKILCICLAVFVCLPFSPLKKTTSVANAAQNAFENVQMLEIVASAGATKQQNRSLVEKGSSEFASGFVYSPNKAASGKNQTIVLSTSKLLFDESKSLFLWCFIPSLKVQDLEVVASDGANEIVWSHKGLAGEQATIKETISEMITNFNGTLKKGWKLFEFVKSDGLATGQSVFEISSLKIKASFNSDSEDDQEFSVTAPFLAQKTSGKTKIVAHQEYVVYAEKQNKLANSNFYVGDKFSVSSEKDFFSYVVVGKQNLFEDKTGFSWNIQLTKPSGARKFFTLDQTREILFDEVGYYLIDVNLTSAAQDYNNLISENFNIYAENFAFGYFQKQSFDVFLGSKTQIVFSLSTDFSLENETLVSVKLGNNLLGEAAYYIEGGKIFIEIDAKTLTNSELMVTATGTKSGETEPKEYQVSAVINVKNATENNSKTVIWVVFGILMAGFFIYLVILFVKSRRFGVK